MGINIDMWYGDDAKNVTHADWSFSDRDCLYRGNLYIGSRIVGDYETADSVLLEKMFGIDFGE